MFLQQNRVWQESVLALLHLSAMVGRKAGAAPDQGSESAALSHFGCKRKRLLVSVIMPAFNAQDCVVAALQSVMDQTEQDFEVIVVDDCSSDETAAVVSAFAKREPRVRLITLAANVGPGAARNLAIEAATGSWVALLDADDRYCPSRLEQLLEMATRNGADMVSDNILVCPKDGVKPDSIMFSEKRIPHEKQLTATEFIAENTNVGMGVRLSFGFMQPMVRRGFLVATGAKYPINRFGEDFMFAVRCLVLGAKWWVTPAPLYLYTVQHGSLTDRVAVDDLLAIAMMEQELIDRSPPLREAGLEVAIRKHKKMVDHWRLVVAIKAALQKRDFDAAFGIVFENGETMRTIAKILAYNALHKLSLV